MHTYWWAGNFGSRFLLVMLPFFSLPIVFSFKKINLKIILALLLVSLVINLSSTIEWTYVINSIMTRCCCIDSFHSNAINSFRLLTNPIFEKNIPYLFDSGPRSKIIESLFIPNQTFQTRDFATHNEFSDYSIDNITLINTPLGIISIKISFITFLTIIIILIIIWQKSVMEFISKYKFALIILFVSSLFYFFTISEIKYGNNWFAEESVNGQRYRWMSDNSTILLSSPKSEIIKLQFASFSFYKNRTMELYLNDKQITSFEILVNKSEVFSTPVFKLNSGINILKIYSLQGCTEPKEIDVSSVDFRCLSFVIWKVQKVSETYE
jgi:hypothetical protein